MSERREQIGKYRIERELGRGAMGIVYQAFDPVVERHVAIKTIHFDNFHPEMLELLKREAKSVGQFEHPNIITLYDAGEADGLFYMVMQLVKGETLRERIHRQRWYKVQQVVDIFRQILAGLNYAHEHGVIHRDIKPANIMITFDGAIKLADFGVSKVIGPAASSSGVVVGTPSYMSPEQVLGRAVDGRTDLFALGCVLYEVVTGEKAYSGDSATAVMYKIVHQAPIPPASLRPGMDPGLEKVVLKALSNDPDDRFADCKEMSKALEDCLARCTVQASRTVELPSLVPTVQPGVTAARVGVTPAKSRWGFRAGVVLPARVLATTGILAALVMGGMMINTRRTGLSNATDAVPPTANHSGPPAVPSALPPAPAVSSGTVVPPNTNPGFMPPAGAPTRPPQIAAPPRVQVHRPEPAVLPRVLNRPPEPVAPSRAPVHPAEPAVASRGTVRPPDPIVAPRGPVRPPESAVSAQVPVRPPDPAVPARIPDLGSLSAAPTASPTPNPPLPSATDRPPVGHDYGSLVIQGDVAFQQNAYDRALSAYLKAYELKPGDSSVRRKLVVVLTLLGRPIEAQKYRR